MRGVALLMLAALGCASPEPWNLGALERAHPELASHRGHRLKDVRPYYLPGAGRLSIFLCRWPDGARVPVEIDAGASAEERKAIGTALDAWEGAGLGIRFERVERLTRVAGIQIRVIDEMIAGHANTIADCGVDRDAARTDRDPLPARLVFASIHLARGDPRLLGATVHELGHALGYQGHPRSGDSVMAPGLKAARLSGEQARKGVFRGDASLSALYALPSGTVLARHRLAPERTRPVDRLGEIAAAARWSGPFTRTGSEEGVFFWRDARGDSISFLMTGLTAALTDPTRLRLTPNPPAQSALVN